MSRVRRRFRGRIAGAGSSIGVRVVVGRWDESPWGGFADVMVEDEHGHRVLLAPDERVRDLVAATYTFDETRLEPVEVVDDAAGWLVRADSLSLRLGVGRRTALGVTLRGIPDRVATSPAWCTVTDPLARLMLRGVRTRGSAGHDRREWYGATDVHRVTSLAGTWQGRDLGSLAPVHPPTRFGFSSTPPRPAVTSVVTTIEG